MYNLKGCKKLITEKNYDCQKCFETQSVVGWKKISLVL